MFNSNPKILIIDDEQFVRDILLDLFSENFECSTAASAAEALELSKTDKFGVVLSDIDLGDMSGIELVPKILKSSPDAAVVMISGNQTIEHAIQAMRAGAFDYIRKPFEIDFVELAVRRAVDHHRLLAGKRLYEGQLEQMVRQRTDQLNHLAYHDPLTDLPNRILFEDRLQQALIAARRDEVVALAFISLDGFQKLQDTLGHSRSDQVLKAVAKRLADEIGDRVTLARIESGEFAILFSGFSQDQDVIGTIESIENAIKQPIALDKNEVFLTASIGVSFYPTDGSDPQELLKKTGAALMRAREMGGESYQFYTRGMNAAAEKRLALEHSLRRAMDKEEFEVFYQPKVDAYSRRIVGMEALIRWNHPEFGLVPPSEFIPLAEESGIIVQLGEWVLWQACTDTKALNDSGFDLNVAVNFSLRQLHQDGLVERIRGILGRTGLPPQYLNLEITESSIMRDPDIAISTLGKLRELGIEISLDDFGTGYSSFGHLKRLPIDVLKIDRSFISDVTTDADDASLTMSMISLAHNLRLKVVAEGVETEEQLRFLDLLRCDHYQGYYFSKPMPVREFTAHLSQSNNGGGQKQNRQR
jgi:diguanylate cyclase (GGDEF)-like protein